MSFIEAELRLNGRGVDAVRMEAFANCTRKLHVARRSLTLEIIIDLHMQRGNQLGVTELPHMEMVATDDAREVENVALDVFDIDAGRRSLEQDTRSSLAERNGRAEDDHSDDQRNERIGVETPREVRKPDDESGSDHTNVSESITHHMEEYSAHVEISVRVTMAMATALAGFLGLVVLVASVQVLRVTVRMARLAPSRALAVTLLQEWGVFGGRGILRSAILIPITIRGLLGIHSIQARGIDNLIPERSRVNRQVAKSTITTPRPRPAVTANLAARAR